MNHIEKTEMYIRKGDDWELKLAGHAFAEPKTGKSFCISVREGPTVQTSTVQSVCKFSDTMYFITTLNSEYLLKCQSGLL